MAQEQLWRWLEGEEMDWLLTGTHVDGFWSTVFRSLCTEFMTEFESVSKPRSK